MAVYWIDFMQSTNGTGTYASPFSGINAQNLVAGDEVRIKSVLKTSIWDSSFGSLTPGSYKMVYSSMKNQGTTGSGQMLFKHSSETAITFNTSYLYYIVELDVFFMTQNSSMSSSTFNSTTESFIYTTPIQIPVSWNDCADHVCTVKLVSTTYRTKAHTGSSTFLGNNASYVDNVTITDGWVDATTRVTDGSAITIFQSGYTSGNVTFSIRYLRGGSTVDLSNTIFMDRTYGGSYVVYNTIDYCGVSNIILGTKLITYGSTNAFQIQNPDDTIIGDCNITVKNYTIPLASSSYYLLYSATNTTMLNLNVDIKKLATYTFAMSFLTDNSTKKLNVKIGNVVSNYYNQLVGTYGVLQISGTIVAEPTITLYGDIIMTQPITNSVSNRTFLVVGNSSGIILKKLDTLFTLNGLTGTTNAYTMSSSIVSKNGYFLPDINTYTNTSFNGTIDPAINQSSYVFPLVDTLSLSNNKSIYNLPNNQVEYNPIKTTILGISKAASTILYTSSVNINKSYGNLLYFPSSDNYIYFLAKINDSSTSEVTYSQGSNRCIMEENTTTYKTVAPSYKVSPDASSTSYKEFFHRWNIPVEANVSYNIKFYTSIINGLPSLNFRNYNFALRYNYGSILTSVITAASQGGWEEHSFTFTSTSAQILSLDLFLTQPLNIITEAYISDFTVTQL